MKLKPKDIAIIAAVIVGIALALYFIFGPLLQGSDDPKPAATDQVLTPIPQVTTEAPPVVAAPTASATPSAAPTKAITDEWTEGSGPGMKHDDPDSTAAAEAARNFIPIYLNAYGYQYPDSYAYLDDLMSKGLITQKFYDNKKNGGPAIPSKTAAKKIEVVTSKIDCPMTSQAGPLIVDGKGTFQCFYRAGYEIDGTDVQRSEMEVIGLPWMEPTETYSSFFKVVKDGDSWKIDGMGL